MRHRGIGTWTWSPPASSPTLPSCSVRIPIFSKDLTAGGPCGNRRPLPTFRPNVMVRCESGPAGAVPRPRETPARSHFDGDGGWHLLRGGVATIPHRRLAPNTKKGSETCECGTRPSWRDAGQEMRIPRGRSKYRRCFMLSIRGRRETAAWRAFELSCFPRVLRWRLFRRSTLSSLAAPTFPLPAPASVPASNIPPVSRRIEQPAQPATSCRCRDTDLHGLAGVAVAASAGEAGHRRSGAHTGCTWCIGISRSVPHGGRILSSCALLGTLHRWNISTAVF